MDKKPFWLSKQRCGFVFLFENLDFDLIACSDDETPIDFSESAKNLIDNLEDWWCVAFLEDLRDECSRRIKEHAKWVEEALKEINDPLASDRK
jgi:hypothetical protein